MGETAQAHLPSRWKTARAGVAAARARRDHPAAGPGPCGRWRLSRRARRQLVLRAGRYRPGRVRGAAGARARVGSMVVRGGVRGDAGVDDRGVGTGLLALDPAPGPGRGAGILRGAAVAVPGGVALARGDAWFGGGVGGFSSAGGGGG